MQRLTFNKFKQNRKIFLQEYNKKDHVILKGENNILLSVQHAVFQIRLGKYKAPEIGSLTTALYLQQRTNSFLIVKTKNNNDDVNFDTNSLYKDNIKNLIKNEKIKFLLDFHGLAQNRDCDVNLGIHLGYNIKQNIKLFDDLLNLLAEKGFKVSIDKPFMANANTICSSITREFDNVWALQIEINSAITNKVENFSRNYVLLNIFERWINTCIKSYGNLIY